MVLKIGSSHFACWEFVQVAIYSSYNYYYKQLSLIVNAPWKNIWSLASVYWLCLVGFEGYQGCLFRYKAIEARELVTLEEHHLDGNFCLKTVL